MEAKICRVFLKIAETSSITKAAQELGYTQAGVSIMVKKMEEECGFTLLCRVKTGVHLTSEGRRMLPVMREIVNWNERFEQLSSSIRGVETGTVRLGCYSSMAYHWVPRIIKKFRKAYPKIDVDIIEGGVTEIEAWIENKTIDIGFLSTRKGQNFETIPLKEDPMLAIMPKNHPLAEEESFPLSAFGESPLVVSVDEYDRDSYNIVEAYKREYGTLPDMKFSSTDGYTIISMIENELGVSVLPGLMLRGHSANIAVKEIEPRFSRTLIMGVHSIENLSPAAAKFVEYAKNFILDMYGQLPPDKNAAQTREENPI